MFLTLPPPLPPPLFSFDVNNLGWYSGTSRVYSDESPGGYSMNTTVDSLEYRVDTIESPLHHYKKQIINLNHLEMEYWKNSFESWTVYKSFNYLPNQNDENVKKLIQVGLHGVQGGLHWVTWYSMEYSLKNQVLLLQYVYTNMMGWLVFGGASLTPPESIIQPLTR